MRRIMMIPLLLLAGCASAPTQTSNVCAVFDQKDGFFNNWYSYAKGAEAQYGVPVPILMATINTESGFQARARPPRTKLLGFIPWTRPSTAYGYSQALDGTWAEFQRSTELALHLAPEDDLLETELPGNRPDCRQLLAAEAVAVLRHRSRSRTGRHHQRLRAADRRVTDRHRRSLARP